MNKFGLLEPEEPNSESRLSEKLSSFPITRQRHELDVEAADAAAARHGFVSREASAPLLSPETTRGRRRRANPPEPTRHLAIRLTEHQYGRFVAYADKHKLTYHDALSRLLDEFSDGH